MIPSYFWLAYLRTFSPCCLSRIRLSIWSRRFASMISFCWDGVMFVCSALILSIWSWISELSSECELLISYIYLYKFKISFFKLYMLFYFFEIAEFSSWAFTRIDSIWACCPWSFISWFLEHWFRYKSCISWFFSFKYCSNWWDCCFKRLSFDANNWMFVSSRA